MIQHSFGYFPHFFPFIFYSFHTFAHFSRHPPPGVVSYLNARDHPPTPFTHFFTIQFLQFSHIAPPPLGVLSISYLNTTKQ